MALERKGYFASFLRSSRADSACFAKRGLQIPALLQDNLVVIAMRRVESADFEVAQVILTCSYTSPVNATLIRSDRARKSGAPPLNQHIQFVFGIRIECGRLPTPVRMKRDRRGRLDPRRYALVNIVHVVVFRRTHFIDFESSSRDDEHSPRKDLKSSQREQEIFRTLRFKW